MLTCPELVERPGCIIYKYNISAEPSAVKPFAYLCSLSYLTISSTYKVGALMNLDYPGQFGKILMSYGENYAF